MLNAKQTTYFSATTVLRCSVFFCVCVCLCLCMFFFFFKFITNYRHQIKTTIIIHLLHRYFLPYYYNNLIMINNITESSHIPLLQHYSTTNLYTTVVEVYSLSLSFFPSHASSSNKMNNVIMTIIIYTYNYIKNQQDHQQQPPSTDIFKIEILRKSKPS